MEKGSLVEVMIHLDFGAYTELLENRFCLLLIILLRTLTSLSLYPGMTVLVLTELQCD